MLDLHFCALWYVFFRVVLVLNGKIFMLYQFGFEIDLPVMYILTKNEVPRCIPVIIKASDFLLDLCSLLL